MASEKLEFGWTVPPGGFRWVQAVVATAEGSKEPRPALVQAEDAGAESPAITPEVDRALFHIFAEVQPDKEGILAFANRFGSLFKGVPLSPAGRKNTARNGRLEGIFLEDWRYHISGMQCLVGLWELLQQGGREQLAPFIEWRKDGNEGLSVHFDSHPDPARGGPPLCINRTRHEIASRDSRHELLATFIPDDPVLPAWAYLQQDLEDHLFRADVRVEARMVWDAGRGRPALHLVAPTLLSAVWLQFADAVSNDRTYSRCRECGKWFEVAPEVARTHRRFCSNACRSKAYRERQDRARRMHMEKKTFEEIAAELDSDAATVRRWITGVKE
jgi:hypothetical protein